MLVQMALACTLSEVFLFYFRIISGRQQSARRHLAGFENEVDDS